MGAGAVPLSPGVGAAGAPPEQSSFMRSSREGSRSLRLDSPVARPASDADTGETESASTPAPFGGKRKPPPKRGLNSGIRSVVTSPGNIRLSVPS